MADTIISNVPGARNSGDGIVMSAVLAIILGAIAVGVLMMYQNGVFQSESPKTDTTDINVTIPTPAPDTTPTPSPTPAPTPGS